MNKTLHRSHNDKIIAGVCGGLAEYFGVDSTIVRLLFVLVVAFGGSGIVLYLLLWLIMPKSIHQPAVLNEENIKEFASEIKDKVNDLKEEFKKKEVAEIKNNKHHGGFFGWLLIILGIVFLANNFMPFWLRAQMANFWPLILVFIGLVVIIGRNNK